MPWPNRSARKVVGVLLLLASVAGVTSVSAAPPPAPADQGKPPSVSTIGPPVALSASQRAAVDAKRAATVMPRTVPEAAPSKAAAISTVPGGTPSFGLKPAVARALFLAPSSAAHGPVAGLTDSRRAREAAAMAALVTALGPEMARRAGLIKDAEQTPIRKVGAPQSRGPQ